MIFKAISFLNYSGCIADVQCDIHAGFPGFDVAINSSFSQSRNITQRLRSSIKSQNLRFPQGTVTVQVCSDRPECCTDDYDLAIVLSIILNSLKSEKAVIAIGSLDLHGNLRSKLCNINSAVAIARKNGIKDILVPFGSFSIQSVDTKGVNIVFVRTLKDAVESCIRISNTKTQKEEISKDSKKLVKMFDGVVGLDNAKFALIVALAGGHNILLVGPRGSGKSLLLSKASEAIPQSTEALRKEREYNKSLLINSHQTVDLNDERVLSLDNLSASKYMAQSPLMSLIAYHSCYVKIDELADIQYRHLQILKDICDKGYVVTKDDKYPLNLSIMAAMNPCPCGNKGLKNSLCTCSKSSLEKHTRVLKTSLLTRFELKVPITPASLASDKEKDYSHYIDKIAKAREIQAERYSSLALNSSIIRNDLAKKELDVAVGLFPFCDNIRDILMLYSVARTIADLDGRLSVTKEDASLAKMLSYQNIDELF